MRPVQLQAAPALYQARHPEQSLLYRTIADHFETRLALAFCGQFDGQGDMHTPAPYVETSFRKYLECGIFAYCFARARCDACGQDFLVAFSCKGHGVCPSCNTRRMVETAAHLSDHIFPKLPVRQWVLSLPKRLRYFLQNAPKALNTALRIFLRVILASLQAHCPSAAALDRKRVQLAACAFIHRFDSSLNTHVHFHLCVVDGVFEAVDAHDGDDGDDCSKVKFYALADLSVDAITQVQNEAKRRIVRAFVKRGLLDSIDGEVMLLARHGGGFSVDASVCIGADDRGGLERLLRYCARPTFAMERLHRKGQDHLLYHYPKPQSGGKQGDLNLTPCEFIAKIAVFVPPPRNHRHRYFGVLAPNSPLRAAFTAMAPMPVITPDVPPTSSDQEDQTNTKCSPARYLWVKLIARIYEVFPLLCLHCGGKMRLIVFINDGAEIRKILDHIGIESTQPKISKARAPPCGTPVMRPNRRITLTPSQTGMWNSMDTMKIWNKV
jgi:hypothetical protein